MPKPDRLYPIEFNDVARFHLSGVTLESSELQGVTVFAMRMPSTSYQDAQKETLTDRDFMAWIPLDFQDGTIEVDVRSNLADDAPEYARGFIGVSFRIDSQGRFESIYLRPTNSVADDQVRRNHTIQYAAFPDFRFTRLRSESPEKYETYADVDLDRWIHLRVVVAEARAELYLDHRPMPAFIIRDLKLGAAQSGGVGIWIESGTLARFRNLTVTNKKETTD